MDAALPLVFAVVVLDHRLEVDDVVGVGHHHAAGPLRTKFQPRLVVDLDLVGYVVFVLRPIGAALGPGTLPAVP